MGPSFSVSSMQYSRRWALRAAAVSPLAYLAGCSQSPPAAIAPPGGPVVRVVVQQNRSKVEVTASQPPVVRAGGSAQPISMYAGEAIPVSYTGKAWTIGDRPVGAGELSIEPAAEGTVRIDGRSHRGSYRFVPKASGKFDVVNDIDVDGYLMGVIGKELYSGWNVETFCAQAIVARTYALYMSRTNPESSTYDLFTDIRSQMYGGIAGESERSREAVTRTRGLVVAYGSPGDERIFKTYYSSCCGGITQPVTVLADPAFEPLVERNVGSRCSISPRFSWPTIAMTKSEITRRLRFWGNATSTPEKNIGDVTRIDIFSANRFGRPTSFAIYDARGYRYRLGCEELRLALSSDASDGIKLPSSFFKPVNEASKILFTDGHGFGHGVGLCQWCAEAQARGGQSHKNIVLDAYPKAVLVRAY